MSVYGLSVKKPGRTSSQISIYDYPEHLNPFYEDENHKRLRFWKLNSGNKKSGRSNSFSLDGLKEMWSFKSFKLKKKSSTLGINKTSESPPMLRRDEDDQYSNNSSYRHTYNVGLGSNFDRGALYRSSLQNINSNRPADNCFLRHSRYRNTVQNGITSPESSSSNRYNCGGPGTETPTLRTKYIRPGLSRGSSQNSVNSSNPFDDDYVDTISQAGSVDGVSVRRSGRKKRRAPQPPTSTAVHQGITTVEEGVTENKENDIKPTNETVNITNLTAEIETFVKTADSDKADLHHSTKHEDDMVVLKIVESDGTKTNTISTVESGQNARQSPENNEYYPERESDSPDRKSNQTHEANTSYEKIENLGAQVNLSNDNNCDRSKRSPVKILIRSPTDEDKDDEETTPNENKPAEEEAPKFSQKFKGKKIVFKYEDEPEKDDENKKNVTVNVKKNGTDAFTQGNTTPKSTEVEFILEHEQCETINDSSIHIDELKITESTDDLRVTSPTDVTAKKFETQNIPLEPSSPVLSRKTVDLKNEESSNEQRNKTSSSPPKTTMFEVRSVPLKNFSPMPDRKQADSSTSAVEDDVIIRNKNDKPPTPPQRRRSVKEIIESINKSQSLLKVNQKDSTGSNKFDSKFDKKYDYKYDYKFNDKFSKFPAENNNNNINYPNGNLDKNSNNLSASDLEINKMILEMDKSISESEITNIPIVVERFNELTKNNQSLFEKCVIRRDAVDDMKSSDNSANVDWNPVPKPRRHRHSTQKP